MKRNVFRALPLLMALPLMVACPFPLKEDDSDDDILTLLFWPDQQMEINGNWISNYGENLRIQATKTIAGGVLGYWYTKVSSYESSGIVVDFSNSTRTAYVRTGVPSWCTGQGTGLNECTCYNAGVCYNRNVWTKSQGKYYYCQDAYNKPSLDEVRSAPDNADESNPGSGGCGSSPSFPWTELNPQ